MDKHISRNKDKYNPYTLKVNIEKSIYICKFKDSRNILQEIKISKEVYDAFDKFELEDISQIHKIRKHIEHNEVYEDTLFHRAIIETKSVEDEVENRLLNEELKNAIKLLNDIQKRRLIKYYFEDKSLEEIALEEGTSHQAISKSIHKAIEEIQKNLIK